MLILFLLFPGIAYVLVNIFVFKARISWRNLIGILLLFASYPAFAFTGKVSVVIALWVIFFVFVRNWRFNAEGTDTTGVSQAGGGGSGGGGGGTFF
ncbi:MAG: hypothetical protein GX020_03625 [Firmicutes bacterium]|nr:hypothetical protein [Bacillota bacterium]